RPLGCPHLMAAGTQHRGQQRTDRRVVVHHHYGRHGSDRARLAVVASGVRQTRPSGYPGGMALAMDSVRWLRHRPLLLLFPLLPLAVAGLAHRLLAVNADIVTTATGDPDGPDLLANVRADSLNVYTSGFACGQLLSFLFGAGL